MQSPKPLRNFHWQFFQMVWWIHVYYTITQNYFFFLLLVIDASRTKLATRWLVNFRFFIRSSGRYTLHIQIKKASKSVTSKRSIFQNVFHCNGSSSTIKRFLTVSSLKEFKIFDLCLAMKRASLVAQLVKNPPAVQETSSIPGLGSSPGGGRGYHSSILGLPWWLRHNPPATWEAWVS